MSNKIEITLHLLTNTLTEAVVKQGIETISLWEADLKTADFRGADTLYDDLTRLRHHLEGGNLSGVAIGELLVSLGGSTERAAALVEGPQGDSLSKMGGALIHAGKSMGAAMH